MITLRFRCLGMPLKTYLEIFSQSFLTRPLQATDEISKFGHISLIAVPSYLFSFETFLFFLKLWQGASITCFFCRSVGPSVGLSVPKMYFSNISTFYCKCHTIPELIASQAYFCISSFHSPLVTFPRGQREENVFPKKPKSPKWTQTFVFFNSNSASYINSDAQKLICNFLNKKDPLNRNS